MDPSKAQSQFPPSTPPSQEEDFSGNYSKYFVKFWKGCRDGNVSKVKKYAKKVKDNEFNIELFFKRDVGVFGLKGMMGVQKSDFMTALMAACSEGYQEIVEFILQFPRVREKINMKSSKTGKTALHHTIEGKFEEKFDLFKLLLENGAQWNIPNQKGRTVDQLCSATCINIITQFMNSKGLQYTPSTTQQSSKANILNPFAYKQKTPSSPQLQTPAPKPQSNSQVGIGSGIGSGIGGGGSGPSIGGGPSKISGPGIGGGPSNATKISAHFQNSTHSPTPTPTKISSHLSNSTPPPSPSHPSNSTSTVNQLTQQLPSGSQVQSKAQKGLSTIKSAILNPFQVQGNSPTQSAKKSKYDRAKVLAYFRATLPDQMSVNVGDIVEILEERETGWWRCKLIGDPPSPNDPKKGFLPSTYLEKFKVVASVELPLPPPPSTSNNLPLPPPPSADGNANNENGAFLQGSNNRISDSFNKLNISNNNNNNNNNNNGSGKISPYNSGGSTNNSGSFVNNNNIQIKVESVKSTGSPSTSSSSLGTSWEIQHDDITLGDKLGVGGCGVVYKGYWFGTEVAVKQLNSGLAADELEEFEQEAQISTTLHYPHIVHLFGITKAEPYYMVMEFMCKGSLYHFLRANQVSFDEKVEIAIGVARGIHFLHRKNIIHRDIKSLNVLLGKSNEVKIADFGLSKVKSALSSKTNNKQSDGKVGTLHWKAPELFRMGGMHTRESDVYALGILLWEVLTCQLPYVQAHDDAQIIAHVLSSGREDIPFSTPAWFSELIQACWHQEASKRPSTDIIINVLQAKTSLSSYLSQLSSNQSNNQPAGQSDNTPNNNQPSSQLSQSGGRVDNNNNNTNNYQSSGKVNANNNDNLNNYPQGGQVDDYYNPPSNFQSGGRIGDTLNNQQINNPPNNIQSGGRIGNNNQSSGKIGDLFKINANNNNNDNLNNYPQGGQVDDYYNPPNNFQSGGRIGNNNQINNPPNNIQSGGRIGNNMNNTNISNNQSGGKINNQSQINNPPSNFQSGGRIGNNMNNNQQINNPPNNFQSGGRIGNNMNNNQQINNPNKPSNNQQLNNPNNYQSGGQFGSSNYQSGGNLNANNASNNNPNNYQSGGQFGSSNNFSNYQSGGQINNTNSNNPLNNYQSGGRIGDNNSNTNQQSSTSKKFLDSTQRSNSPNTQSPPSFFSSHRRG